MFPKKGNKQSDPYYCSVFQPAGTFQTTVQGVRKQAEHSNLAELRRQQLEFREVEATGTCRGENQRGSYTEKGFRNLHRATLLNIFTHT